MTSVLILAAALLGVVGLFVIVQFVRGKLARNITNANSAVANAEKTVTTKVTAVETVAKGVAEAVKGAPAPAAAPAAPTASAPAQK